MLKLNKTLDFIYIYILFYIYIIYYLSTDKNHQYLNKDNRNKIYDDIKMNKIFYLHGRHIILCLIELCDEYMKALY